MKKLMIALMIPALLVGCNKDDKPKKPESGSVLNMFDTQTVDHITITTIEGQAIPGAQILIGEALDAPFSGNFLTTDANGQIEIPAGWTMETAVTVQAPGFLRTTYWAQTPGALTLKLRPMTTQAQHEVRGNTQGLPIQDKDGFVDFGLVMPAFSKIDMLSFDIDKVISPQSDRISSTWPNHRCSGQHLFAETE